MKTHALALAIDASKILCQAAVAIEPSESSFKPPQRRGSSSDRVSGALDDLNGAVAEFGEGGVQVGPVVDAVGKQVA